MQKIKKFWWQGKFVFRILFSRQDFEDQIQNLIEENEILGNANIEMKENIIELKEANQEFLNKNNALEEQLENL